MPNTLASTEEIIADLRAGKMVILVDEEDRENEGDLVLAADHVTAEAVNFVLIDWLSYAWPRSQP